MIEVQITSTNKAFVINLDSTPYFEQVGLEDIMGLACPAVRRQDRELITFFKDRNSDVQEMVATLEPKEYHWKFTDEFQLFDYLKNKRYQHPLS